MYQFNETLSIPSKDCDDQLSSPKLTVSPTLSSSKVKRGFKSNSSAAFLRKRVYSGKEGTEDGSDNLSTQTSLSSLDDKSSKASSPGESFELKEGGTAHFIDTSDSTTTADEEAFEGGEDHTILPQKFYRVMVIGPRDVGKRSFVNGLFSSNGGCEKSQKQTFDLIVKTVADGIHNKRYNFWLKESEGLRKNYNSIYNVYYETCSVIFLVYNSEDEDSMNFIEKELESLKDINSRRNKNIVVLDTNNSPRSSEAPQLEELKSKYGFKMSLELNRMSHSDKGILDIIDNICENSE